MSDVDQAAFRRAAGQFPGGIVVVTTSGGHAMTVSAFASVSLEPPLVLFCAEKIARFHDAVLEAGAWAVSILAEDGEKTARWLATRGRPLVVTTTMPPGNWPAARRKAAWSTSLTGLPLA